MLIGFGFKHTNGDASDEAALKKIGCERLFFWTQLDDVMRERDRMIEFLRRDDTLAVVTLDRLESDFMKLLQFLARLQERHIKLHVAASGIRPGTPLGDSFLSCCAVLAETSLSLEHQLNEAASTGKSRRRGRPNALSKNDQIKVRQLLVEKGERVLDVARQLRVSPATIYRHSPRRGKDRGK